jgi:hypothetical protein
MPVPFHAQTLVSISSQQPASETRISTLYATQEYHSSPFGHLEICISCLSFFFQFCSSGEILSLLDRGTNRRKERDVTNSAPIKLSLQLGALFVRENEECSASPSEECPVALNFWRQKYAAKIDRDLIPSLMMNAME